jgi:hypothetical protein
MRIVHHRGDTLIILDSYKKNGVRNETKTMENIYDYFPSFFF